MATSFGAAGKGPRAMAKARYAKVSVIAGFFLLVAIFLFFGSGSLAKLGLPVVVILLFVMKTIVEHLEKEGNRLKKRAKQAEKGAAAEEKVSDRLSSLPEEYRYFNAVDFDRFDIDHMVVGPIGYLNNFLLRRPKLLSAEDIEHLSKVLSNWLSRHEKQKSI
ncbi:MAG: nuclease-related domain-containing protein [Syntrophobacteraceae bacterium]